MSEPLPAPLVPTDIDLRGFSDFMLDVDRLLASELVALGTPEECWAAFMLWCRAWKQSPPGSLPDNDKVLAAFSGAGARWLKIKGMALRGFVLCSDGRLYHPVLAEQVSAAWQKRKAYRNDQDRLKKWREERRGNASGNAIDGQKETPLKRVSSTVSDGVSSTVSEPDRQGQGQGQGQGQRGEESSLRSDTTPKKSEPNGRRLPEGWNPGEEGAAFAKGLGMHPETRFEKFRDYWAAQPGAKGRKLDWLGTWRNWCRSEAERRGTVPQPKVATVTHMSGALF